MCLVPKYLVLAIAGLMLAAPALAGEAKTFPDDWFWGEPEQQETHNAMVGKEPPAFTVEDWHGEAVTAEDMKGKVVLVDIWATWCGPCIGAIPHTNELLEKYEDDGLVVVGICGTRGAETMHEVAKEHEMKYPSAKDVDNKTKEAWNVMWWPTFAVIDHTGVVRGVGLQTSKVEAAVEQLLEEKAAAEEKKTEKTETGD